MAKALKTVAIIASVAALAVVTGGAAAGLGISLATTAFGVSAGALVLASTAASLGAALLTKAPKIPSAQTDRLTANIDPRAFRKTVLGQTAFPVDVRYEEWSGTDQEYCDWIVALASHAIDGVEEIWLNTDLAWSQATGVNGKYVGYFSVPNIILEGSPANAFTFASGKWNGSARLTGCAYARLRFKVTGNGKKGTSPFSSGIPSRITIIGRGAKLYDPRRDSTVPGGAGPMRWNDQSTWRYTADDGAVIGENLPLHALRVVLGWQIRNPVTGEMRLATGSGVPGRRLKLESWIEAANLADELVNRSAGGQEPRYHGAGVVSEGDDPGTSLDAICAACNGLFRDTAGRLSFSIAHNDLAAAATDDGLTDDDVVGAHGWDPDAALDATPNVVRGQYVDASTGSLYQLVDYPEVRIASPDGQDRVLILNLGMCESASQAQRIAKQVLQRRQYQREFTAPFDIRAWKYPVGAVLPFTFAPLSFSRALFRVKAQELGQDGICNMTLTVEHQALYQWDKDDRAPVQAADPIAYDASRNPLVLAIADLDLQVTQILSDGVITRGREKRDLKLQWTTLVAQFDALDDRYDSLGNPDAITPARNAAQQELIALEDYLIRLAPAWDNPAVDTPVDGAALNALWTAARTSMEVFAAAITGIPGRDGRDGVNGKDGAPGRDGINGGSAYFHVAYANSADGSVAFTTGEPGTRAYLGVAVDENAADPEDYRVYAWSLIKGRDGLNGADGTPGARGADGRQSYVHFAYANSANGSVDFSVDDPGGRAFIGVYSDYTLADSTDYHAYSWSLAKGQDGADGAQGPRGPQGNQGAAGTDGFSIEVSVPVFAIPCFSNGNPDPARWSGGSGKVQLRKAGAPVDGVSYSIVGNSNVTSLSITGTDYSFAALSAQTGFFILRATYLGRTYDIKIEVKKVLDGSAAFKASVPIGSEYTAATTTVPAARRVRISASASYFKQSYGAYTGVMSIYVRNLTDNGALQFLGQTEGSQAYFYPGPEIAPGEPGPDSFAIGSVAAAFEFTSASADKQYEYSCRLAGKYGGSAEQITGSLQLEVIA